MQTIKRIVMLVAVCAIAMPASADWDPGDPHKMHFPQLPDPNGWDVPWHTVYASDDWQCTETGSVSDIHLWVSYQGWNEDHVPYPVNGMQVRIRENIPANQSGFGYAIPGELLWARDFVTSDIDVRHAGSGDQGYYDPPPFDNYYTEHDHTEYFQLNIMDIEDPFIQQEGTIYWLQTRYLRVGTGPEPYIGWKTSGVHFGANAIHHYPHPGYDPSELYDPITGEGLDFAFVITPEPATLSLLALGGLAVLRRRPKQ